MKLHELQADFCKSIIDGDVTKSFLDVIKSSNNLSNDLRLKIYRDSSRGALLATLKETFPICLVFLGKERFTELSLAFISSGRQWPKPYKFLNAFGDKFAEFIANYKDNSQWPYIEDLTYLEWLIHLAYIGYDDRPMSIIELSSIEEELQPKLIFHLARNSSLYKSRYIIDELWEWGSNLVNIQPKTIYVEDEFRYLFIMHVNNVLKIERLSYDEYQLLEQIQKKVTLAEAVNNMDNPEQLTIVLPKLFQKRYIIAATTS